MSYLSGLGKNIRIYRRSIGLTQRELAQKLHVSTQAISSWEQGNTYPDIENLCRLAEALSVTTDKLLKRSGEANAVYMIGIDGGKVKTDFVLFSSLGTVKKAFRLPGTSAAVKTMSELLSILRRGIDLCLEQCPSTSYIYLGSVGGHLAEIQQQLSEIYTGIEIVATSCAANVFGCLDGADAGMVLGAGSGVCRREGDGFRDIGGWGHVLGDPGSGYNFGREACRLAYAYRDGLDCDPLIYTLVKERMRDKALCVANLTPLQISALAPVIFEADAQGDERAGRVIESEMRELSALVNAACPQGGKIIAVGGVIENRADRLLPVLRKMIDPRIEVIVSKFPAVYGACRAAIRHFAVETCEDFDKKFAAGFAAAAQI